MRVVAALVLAAGCTPDGPTLERIEVRRATLKDARFSAVAVIGGVVVGGGDLVIVSMDGERYDLPVALSGPLVGMIAEADLGVVSLSEGDLTIPNPGTRGDRLLGTYRGLHGGTTVGLGLTGEYLVNEHFVSFAPWTLTVGLGWGIGWEWLEMRVKPEAWDELDTGFAD